MFIVFIAKKQWNKVKDAIKNPKDVLIVEGYPSFDKRLKNMTVFAQSVTTKELQRAKREAQQTKG